MRDTVKPAPGVRPQPDTAASSECLALLDSAKFWDSNEHLNNSEIARLLGCHRQTVAEARRRNQRVPAPRGRPRETDTRPVPTSYVPTPLPESFVLVLERYSYDTAAPTNTMLVQRWAGLDRAQGDLDDEIHALTELTSGLHLQLTHKLTLRDRWRRA